MLKTISVWVDCEACFTRWRIPPSLVTVRVEMTFMVVAELGWSSVVLLLIVVDVTLCFPRVDAEKEEEDKWKACVGWHKFTNRAIATQKAKILWRVLLLKKETTAFVKSGGWCVGKVQKDTKLALLSVTKNYEPYLKFSALCIRSIY